MLELKPKIFVELESVWHYDLRSDPGKKVTGRGKAEQRVSLSAPMHDTDYIHTHR